MATVSKALFRGAASTSSATLYTAPNTSTTTIVTNIIVTNTTSSAASFSLSIDGTSIGTNVPVVANDSSVIDIKQVIPASSPAKTITGLASTTGVSFHISGVEIS